MLIRIDEREILVGVSAQQMTLLSAGPEASTKGLLAADVSTPNVNAH